MRLSPMVRASIMFAVVIVWVAYGGYFVASGFWIMGLVVLVAAALLAFLGYRTIKPRGPKGPIRPLRAPRPPR